MNEQALLAFSNMAVYVRIEGDRMLVHLGDISRDHMAAVKKIRADPETGVVKEISSPPPRCWRNR
jgi:hypothetical protein